MRLLGSVVCDSLGKEIFVRDLVQGWMSKLKSLIMIEHSQPWIALLILNYYGQNGITIYIYIQRVVVCLIVELHPIALILNYRMTL